MQTDCTQVIVKAKAPVNIAVIKYWGKDDDELKIPLNDSLSGTLSMDDMCTTTTVVLSENFEYDKLVLNGREQILNNSPAGAMLQDIRSLVRELKHDEGILKMKAHITSDNNFPTAAGLASSASGYACLAFALGRAYGFTNQVLLSKIARKGSGSACRSLFGGFVHWSKGSDHDSSNATQVVDHKHWPSMRVIICVVNDDKKDVPSSGGMKKSVDTSSLLKYRAQSIVPERISAIKEAIINKDFESFAEITMKDSNQFHAICLDTFPPIFYLNETSKHIIKTCSIINEFYGKNKVAYTFDAGPNACIYLMEDFVSEFIEVLNCLFSDGKLLVKGREFIQTKLEPKLKERLLEASVGVPSGIKYVINTSIGEGPKICVT